mmetsp:Transcript_8596/g.20111  ORF Transcript_8596/g.20111 Transcript_8596/m.20111 type:complete len:243 (+) Transcript_8596:687-1415(+)
MVTTLASRAPWRSFDDLSISSRWTRRAIAERSLSSERRAAVSRNSTLGAEAGARAPSPSTLSVGVRREAHCALISASFASSLRSASEMSLASLLLAEISFSLILLSTVRVLSSIIRWRWWTSLSIFSNLSPGLLSNCSAKSAYSTLVGAAPSLFQQMILVEISAPMESPIQRYSDAHKLPWMLGCTRCCSFSSVPNLAGKSCGWSLAMTPATTWSKGSDFEVNPGGFIPPARYVDMIGYTSI